MKSNTYQNNICRIKYRKKSPRRRLNLDALGAAHLVELGIAPASPELLSFFFNQPVEVRRHPDAAMLAEARETMIGEPCLHCGKRFTADTLRPAILVFSHVYMQCLCPGCAAALTDAAIIRLQIEHLHREVFDAEAHGGQPMRADLTSEYLLIRLHQSNKAAYKRRNACPLPSAFWDELEG